MFLDKTSLDRMPLDKNACTQTFSQPPVLNQVCVWICVVRAFSEEAILHEAVLPLRLDPRRSPHRRYPVIFDHSGNLIGTALAGRDCSTCIFEFRGCPFTKDFTTFRDLCFIRGVL
jgi:hypothetical protein